LEAAFPPLIAARDIDDSLVLIEGTLAPQRTGDVEAPGLEALVARGPDLANWKYY
jgi:hypothetical protein